MTVRAICQKEGIPCHEIRALGGGQINAVLCVDDQWVVRIATQPDAHARLLREAELLNSLAGQLPVSRLFAWGELDGRAYQIQGYVRGEKWYIAWPRLNATQQESLVAQLSAALKVLHARQVAAFGAPYDPASQSGSWLDYLIGRLSATLEEYASLHIRMTPGALESVADYFEVHKDVLRGGIPVQIHGDLNLTNLLVSGDRLVAMLDLEFALWAPRDYELLALEAFCLYPNDWAEEEHENYCTGDYATLFPLLQKHYPEIFDTPHLRERVNLYQLLSALSSYLAWRKANLATIPPDRMDAYGFYMARITNFTFRNGTRLF